MFKFNGKELKTVVDVAAELGYSKTTLINWMKNGDIPDEHVIVKRGKQEIKTYSDSYIKKI